MIEILFLILALWSVWGLASFIVFIHSDIYDEVISNYKLSLIVFLCGPLAICITIVGLIAMSFKCISKKFNIDTRFISRFKKWLVK